MNGQNRKLWIYTAVGFVFFIMIISVFFSSYVQADDWNYRKQHVIIGSPSGPQVNYQIKLVVHYGSGTDSGEEVYCDSNCRGDFGDIRFTDSDGFSLDYWIEEKTDFDKAKIWVEIPYIPVYPDSTGIYMHYGNSDASTTSDGKATFLIFDDFNDDSFNTSLWEDISQASGVVSETGDVLKLSSQPGCTTAAQVRSKVSYTGKCSVHARWCPKTPPNLGGAAIIRVSDEVDPDLKNMGVEFWWGGMSSALDNFILSERNIKWVITNSVPELSRWYNIELKIREESAEVWVDDIESASLSMTKDYTDDETLEVGMRVNSWNGAKNSKITQYDWIFLRKLCDPEPTQGVPGELGRVTFSVSGLDFSASGTVLVVDDANYTYSNLPKEFDWELGESHSFEWKTPVDGGPGKRFMWVSTSGLSTSISGSVIVPFGGSVSASYKTQCYLTVNSAYGNPNPASGWFDSGTIIGASVSSPLSSGTGIHHICTGWSGTGSLPPSGTGTLVYFEMNAPSTITWRWKTIQLYLSCSSSSSYIGFKVEIEGYLACNQVGLSEAPILLSYSVTGGQSWEDLTLVYTDPDGNFSAVWMPFVTGNYLIKATWAGNATCPEIVTIVNLAVAPYEEGIIFSVSSNSTLSVLTFDTSCWTLRFNVSGPPGTHGYVKITVAKSLVPNATEIKVYLDLDQLDFSITSMDDSWLLLFTYSHSNHNVAVDLDPNVIPEFPSFLILPLFMIATLLIVIVYRRK